MATRPVLLLSAVAALVLVGCTTPATTPSPAPTTDQTGGAPEVSTEDLGAESVTVEPFADFLISSGDLMWVSGVDPGIVAFDDTMTPVFEVPADVVWAALDFGHGYVWAAEAPGASRATTLIRIDPATGEAVRFAVPDPGIPPESSLAVTDDAVWAIVGPDQGVFTLVGFDPGSGAVLRSLPIVGSAAAVRGGFGSLWVTTPPGQLLRLDPATGDVLATIELERSLTFLSIGADAIWVINQPGTLFRVDPATNAVVATIEASDGGIQGGDVVATADSVWVQANAYLGVHIDPATNEVVNRIVPGEGSGSIGITADGAVWISAHDALKLYRIPPD